GFVEDEQLQLAGRRRIVNRGAGAMQDVKQEGRQQERILVESFEVEALDTLQRQRVLGVVEQVRVGAALHPAMQVLRETSRQRVRQRNQAPLRRIEGVEVLDGLVEVPIVGHGELVLPARL